MCTVQGHTGNTDIARVHKFLTRVPAEADLDVNLVSFDACHELIFCIGESTRFQIDVSDGEPEAIKAGDFPTHD